MTSQRRAGAPTFSAGSPFTARPEPEVEVFAVGDRVTQDADGLGRVVQVGPTSVVVEFGGERTWIASPFRRLHKL